MKMSEYNKKVSNLIYGHLIQARALANILIEQGESAEWLADKLDELENEVCDDLIYDDGRQAENFDVDEIEFAIGYNTQNRRRANDYGKAEKI